ncbi:MAG: TetR/AcrR family transcriptional regulator [Actinobacteria bacterium]|nr:TetR/AcrR family transcriptional regulator [Actinomycetota bacterium]
MEDTLVRRTPQQARSRAKVSAILKAAATMIDESGVEGLTTVAVAERAKVAGGTFYQYFAHRAEETRVLDRRGRHGRGVR